MTIFGVSPIATFFRHCCPFVSIFFNVLCSGIQLENFRDWCAFVSIFFYVLCSGIQLEKVLLFASKCTPTFAVFFHVASFVSLVFFNALSFSYMRFLKNAVFYKKYVHPACEPLMVLDSKTLLSTWCFSHQIRAASNFFDVLFLSPKNIRRREYRFSGPKKAPQNFVNFVFQ